MRSACWIAICCVVAGLCNFADAADKRAVKAEDYYGFRDVSAPRISPDGRQIVFLVTVAIEKTNKKISNLWIVPSDGSSEPRALTNNVQSSAHPQWSADGRSIAFISARPAPIDGVAGRAQVQLLPLNGGEARAITSLKNGVIEFRFSPDGKRLACLSLSGRANEESTSNTPDKSDTRHYTHALNKIDGIGYLTDRHLHLWVVDVASGKAKQITDGDDWDDSDPEWSPDGSRIAFSSNRTGHALDGGRQTDIWTISAEGGALTRISNHDTTAWKQTGFSPMHYGPHWSPDGRKIAFLGSSGDEGESSIWIATAAGEAPAQEVVASIDGTTNDFLWRKTGLFYLANDRGARQIFRADPANGKVVRMTTGDRTISALDIAEHTGAITFMASDFQHPYEVFSTDRKLRGERQVSFVNRALLEQLAVPQLKRVEFSAEDGLPLEGFFSRPVDWREGRQYPLVLEVHGGPNIMYGFSWWLRDAVLLGEGYALFYMNPRGSTGYGEKFQRAVNLEWGGKAYTDLMKGVDVVLAQNPWIDPQRLGVRGASFGGYMTNWIISHTTRFAAAIPMSSISDFISLEGTRDAFYNHEQDFGGDLFQNFDLYWRYSPLRYAQDVRTPTLILHGEADNRVPLEQAEQWFRALRHFNVPAELVILPREYHTGIITGEPKHVVEVLRWNTYWFDKYLNHNEAAIPPDAVRSNPKPAAANNGPAAP